MGEQINTEGYEISPFLSDDKQALFFASNGHPGYGNTDVFVSYRQDSSWTNWSNPENLGDGINSAGFDAYLTVSGDSQVFFVSNSLRKFHRHLSVPELLVEKNGKRRWLAV